MNCSICLDKVTLIQGGTCQHRFCRNCLELYVRDSISTGAHKITCPQCPSVYGEQQVQLLCPELLAQYIQSQQRRVVICALCNEELPRHRCQQNVCNQCGDIHDGTCGIRCPQCSIPIEKITGCNHMTCKCRYQFCWICGGAYSRIHYRLWNVCGCPIPGAMMLDITPLRHPNLIRLALAIPRIIAFLLIITCLIILYPLFCLTETGKFHHAKFKQHKLYILLVLLFPFTYLIELFYWGPQKAKQRIQKLR